MRDLSQYDGLRHLIDTGDLIEWCGNGLLSAAIRGVTGAGVSHSSLVVRMPYGDQTRRYVVEAIGSGIEFRFLSDLLQTYDGTAVWYGLKPQYDHKRGDIGAWAMHEVSLRKKYDWAFTGILGQVFGKRVQIEAGRWFCSEVIDSDYIDNNLILPHPQGARWPGEFTKTGIFLSMAHILE